MIPSFERIRHILLTGLVVRVLLAFLVLFIEQHFFRITFIEATMENDPAARFPNIPYHLLGEPVFESCASVQRL